MPVYVQIPGYREAVEREADLRAEAFLCNGRLTDEISGVNCRPLTGQMALMLEACGNPWIRGGMPDPVAAAQLLWIVSDQYAVNTRARDKFIRRLCLKWDIVDGEPKSFHYMEAVDGISRYIEESYLDAPSQPGRDVSFAHWVASIVDRLASEYGWSVEYCMSLPLRQVFQLLKQMTVRRTGKTTNVCNRLSDGVKARWLAEQNKPKEDIQGN